MQVRVMNAKRCISTKKLVSNDHGAVTFLCPKCGEQEITRSTYARANAIAYNCPCGFVGPN